MGGGIPTEQHAAHRHHCGAGQRIHKLEPDPAAAPVVQRIFRLYVDGMSSSAIAAQLTREGIPCPSAHDTTRNPHRKKTARQQGAVRAILLNPRYTGHEVWNKQRKEERLLDVDDVTLGHRTHMTHNPPHEWIHGVDVAQVEAVVWIRALADHPILIQRPLITADETTVVGRSADAIRSVLA
ncbi:recombinase family protein [Streptomyces sp. NPDC050743]|uniref:recombinase family protein n=1 Tax=Streptomyces sp. NPDC050743 TaxID=3365634 RepID=UPI0037A3E8F7